MEAHKSICQAVRIRALDLLRIQIGRHAVVNIQQGHRVPTDAGADKLGQHAVNIHLAGHGNALGGQAAVYITGHKLELRLECGPALAGNGHILASALVGLHPVQQSQLVLGQLGQNLRLLIALAQLFLHLRFRLCDDLRILIHIDRCACHCLCRVDQSLVCQSALALGNNLPGVARCSSRPCSNVGLGSRAVPAHVTDVRGTEGHDSVRVERSDKAVHALALMGKDFRLSCFVLAALRDLL